MEKLQIFRDTYKLTNLIYAAMPEMAKLHRYNMGKRLLDSSLELFTCISLINRAVGLDRLPLMDNLHVNFELVRVHLKLCSDNKLLKMGTLVSMFLLLDNISKQLAGWRAYTVRAQR